MGSKSKSSKTSSNQTTNVNSTFDGEQNFQLVNSSSNEITLTDHGAIDRTFDSFDRVISSNYEAIDRTFDSFDDVVSSNSATVKNAVSAISANTDKTVDSLKDFATTLKVGDITGAKWIAIAIILAVLIAVVFFIWKGKK